MTWSLVNPDDPLERQNAKLLEIAGVLMRRVEQTTDDSGAAYAQFQRAAMLEEQVRERTLELEQALDLLNDANARLAAANRETEAARQNLANAIETVQEGFALFDSDDVLVMCNSRFGMHMLDIHDALKPGLTFAQYIDRVSRSRYLALPEGEDPDAWAARRKRRHHDRHVIFNVRMIWDRWVQVSEHRTMDGGTVILQTDVTDIIRLERHERSKLLDDQARVIRATLDHINQGVAIFGHDHRLVDWNQRLGALLALPRAGLRNGADFEDLLIRLGDELAFGAGMSAAALREWVHSDATRPALTFEVRRGADRVLAVLAQEMPDRGFVISFTDISAERAAIAAMAHANETLEQRVMERTLELEDALSDAERANASRSRFVAAASHDLLQPLSAAKLYISSIDDSGIAARTRETLEKAQNALISVEGILGALLDISKLESGLAAVDITAVRLDRLLRQLHDEFAPMAAAKGISLRIVPCTALVESDASYLRRILQNLIGNALRYTETGKVLVGARRRRGGVRLEVWDTGPGIPEEEQDNIFKEFHRLNAHASASEGMGLGLAIVERACALLGHPLGLWSEPGKGTRFFVSVPFAEARPAPVGRPALAPPVTPAAPTDTLALLVENDAELRRAMCQLLEKWGISVFDVKDGEAAAALLDEIGMAPDVMLVDYQLGEGMTGLEAVAALRARHGPVPAQIITANRSPEVRMLCEAAGVGLMYKPIDARALETYLNALAG